MRHGKDAMIIGNGEYVFDALHCPFPSFRALTLWTVSVTARVVVNDLVSAHIALEDMHTKFFGAAGHDGVCGFELLCAASMMSAKACKSLSKNISYLISRRPRIPHEFAPKLINCLS